MKLPKLPAPMTAKFVYPDMSEFELSTGVFEFNIHPCSDLLFIHFSEPSMFNSFRYARAMVIIHFIPSNGIHLSNY